MKMMVGLTHMNRGTVLVVDDDPLIVELLWDMLECDEYRVETVMGAATPGVARDLRPDVILLDIHMPGMDGTEVCRLLRADPLTAAIPVIALSAAHNLHAHAADMDADDYLSKPFELSELLAKVAAWAGRAEQPEGDKEGAGAGRGYLKLVDEAPLAAAYACA
jgi:DNA-binding response OmpR family regulator